MTDKSERTKPVGHQDHEIMAPGDEAPPRQARVRTCARIAAVKVASMARSATHASAEGAWSRRSAPDREFGGHRWASVGANDGAPAGRAKGRSLRSGDVLPSTAFRKFHLPGP